MHWLRSFCVCPVALSAMAAIRLIAHDLATQPEVCRKVVEQRQCRKKLVARSTYLASDGGDVDSLAQCLEDVVVVDYEIDTLLASLRTAGCVQQNAKTQGIQVKQSTVLARTRSQLVSTLRGLDHVVRTAVAWERGVG